MDKLTCAQKSSGMASFSQNPLSAEDVLLEILNTDSSDDEIDFDVEEPMFEGSDDDLEPEDADDR